MYKMKGGKILIVVFSFCLTVFYARFDDFCNNIYEYYLMGSQTVQDKYLSTRLNNIANGNKTQIIKAAKDILKIISKKRTGICSVKFLESLSTYINDYINALDGQGNAAHLSSRIKQYVGDKVICLMVRNELNSSGDISLPKAVCNINKCHSTLLQLHRAFTTGVFMQDSKNILLSSFLQMFWRNYHNSRKVLTTNVRNTWRNDICGYINVNIIKPMMKNNNVSDFRELIDDNEFKRNVSDYVMNYFSKILLHKCGKVCIDKIMKLSEDKELNCNLRSQLLGLVASSFTETFAMFVAVSPIDKRIDKELAVKLFAMIENLLKDKCYSVELVMDVLFDIELYKDSDIMKIVLDNIFPAIGNDSFDTQFIKYMLISGFMNISDRINQIKLKDRLLEIFRNEFENSSNYDYKELLLRALFAFNEYKYILKNKHKLFEEFITRSRNSKVKGIPDAQADFFVNTTLQIGGLYGMDIFRDFIAKNGKVAIESFNKKGVREEDVKYHTILFSLFPYNNKGEIKKFLLRILNGNYSTLLKQYAIKSLLYVFSRDDLLLRYLNKFFKDKKMNCLTALIRSLIRDKTISKNVDSINNCEFIKMNTKAVQEIVKISFDENWKYKLRNNQNALNVFSLDFPNTDRLITYDTCNVGHKPSNTPPTFIKNVIYGLEYDEKDKKVTCDKLVFLGSMIYLMLNNLSNPLLYKKLDKYTDDFIYRGSLKFIMRKIARELNSTVDFRGLKNKNYEYLLQLYAGFILPQDVRKNHSLSSYRTLLTRISERFLITFLLTRTKEGVNVIKILPYATAANLWQNKIQNYFK